MRRFTLVARSAVVAASVSLCACGPGWPTSPPKPPTPMQAAFATAFGKPPPYSTLDESGDRVTYAPEALIDVAPGVTALISEGALAEGCKACAGALTIDYLRRSPDGFSRLGSWPRIGGRGGWGRALPWSIRRDIDDGPTLVTVDRQNDSGCSATVEELITLTPTRPVKIATVVVATAVGATPAEQAANHVEGRIAPLDKGRSFVVRLSGSQTAQQVWRRQGDVFRTWAPGAPGC